MDGRKGRERGKGKGEGGRGKGCPGLFWGMSFVGEIRKVSLISFF
jgi:hypothetical protein